MALYKVAHLGRQRLIDFGEVGHFTDYLPIVLCIFDCPQVQTPDEHS